MFPKDVWDNVNYNDIPFPSLNSIAMKQPVDSYATTGCIFHLTIRKGGERLVLIRKFANKS
jgi:hypothetical protein